jgi:hypothetical protein
MRRFTKLWNFKLTWPIYIEIDKRSFLKLSFANKGLDGINLGNILHHKSVKSKIPPDCKEDIGGV